MEQPRRLRRVASSLQELALADDAFVVEVEGGVEDDAVEVAVRFGDAAERGVRAEGDVDGAVELLVFEDDRNYGITYY